MCIAVCTALQMDDIPSHLKDVLGLTAGQPTKTRPTTAGPPQPTTGAGEQQLPGPPSLEDGEVLPKTALLPRDADIIKRSPARRGATKPAAAAANAARSAGPAGAAAAAAGGPANRGGGGGGGEDDDCDEGEVVEEEGEAPLLPPPAASCSATGVAMGMQPSHHHQQHKDKDSRKGKGKDNHSRDHGRTAPPAADVESDGDEGVIDRKSVV